MELREAGQGRAGALVGDLVGGVGDAQAANDSGVTPYFVRNSGLTPERNSRCTALTSFSTIARWSGVAPSALIDAEGWAKA